jgi:hypothetical protein
MLRFALSISLALSIAACPLTCRLTELLASFGATEDAHASEGCPHCCGDVSEHAAEGPHDEAPPPDCPCKSQFRDCICSGAVIDGPGGFEPSLLLSLDVPDGSAAHSTASTAASDEYSVGTEHLSSPDGRCLRTAISSFLC